MSMRGRGGSGKGGERAAVDGPARARALLRLRRERERKLDRAFASEIESVVALRTAALDSRVRQASAWAAALGMDRRFELRLLEEAEGRKRASAGVARIRARPAQVVMVVGGEPARVLAQDVFEREFAKLQRLIRRRGYEEEAVEGHAMGGGEVGGKEKGVGGEEEVVVALREVLRKTTALTNTLKKQTAELKARGWANGIHQPTSTSSTSSTTTPIPTHPTGAAHSAWVDDPALIADTRDLLEAAMEEEDAEAAGVLGY